MDPKQHLKNVYIKLNTTMEQFVLSEYQPCGNQTDLFTYICHQELKAELIGELVSYFLHIIVFGIFFIYLVLKNAITFQFIDFLT